MRVWILEPRDPLIARDAKPFGIGVRAATLPFPFPSTLTGAARTRAGLENGIFDPHRKINGIGLAETVKAIPVRGPLLVELDEETGQIRTWLAPAPLDALLQRNAGRVVHRLVPLDSHKGFTNLRQRPHAGDSLDPVGLTSHIPGKPYGEKAIPRFWYWEKFAEWLCNPQQLVSTVMKIEELGHHGAPSETRTHVAIDPDSQTALDGRLFQTRGLEFSHGNSHDLAGVKRLALAVAVDDAPLSDRIANGLAPIGGERRIAAWRLSDNGSFPTGCLGRLQDQIASDRACRLILLTPAYFAAGSKPGFLSEDRSGVKVTLRAFASKREQVVSGWDFAKPGPKGTRRLAPAGSVYFLTLDGGEADIKRWVEQTWMSCVSDDPEFRRDGFGLAALGQWSGKLESMEVR
jgi:CRISPR-associated protein Cmr3